MHYSHFPAFILVPELVKYAKKKKNQASQVFQSEIILNNILTLDVHKAGFYRVPLSRNT